MTNKKNRYVGGWISKADFLDKYSLFTPRHLTNLITKRHDNGFSICCKMIGNRSVIHEDLVAVWIREQDETLAA